jgi:hypothetical protein
MPLTLLDSCGGRHEANGPIRDGVIPRWCPDLTRMSASPGREVRVIDLQEEIDGAAREPSYEESLPPRVKGQNLSFKKSAKLRTNAQSSSVKIWTPNQPENAEPDRYE